MSIGLAHSSVCTPCGRGLPYSCSIETSPPLALFYLDESLPILLRIPWVGSTRIWCWDHCNSPRLSHDASFSSWWSIWLDTYRYVASSHFEWSTLQCTSPSRGAMGRLRKASWHCQTKKWKSTYMRRCLFPFRAILLSAIICRVCHEPSRRGRKHHKALVTVLSSEDIGQCLWDQNTDHWDVPARTSASNHFCWRAWCWMPSVFMCLCKANTVLPRPQSIQVKEDGRKRRVNLYPKTLFFVQKRHNEFTKTDA